VSCGRYCGRDMAFYTITEGAYRLGRAFTMFTGFTGRPALSGISGGSPPHDRAIVLLLRLRCLIVVIRVTRSLEVVAVRHSSVPLFRLDDAC
jgi:hypothetical protein